MKERRNLSGIYIFEKNKEGKRVPTCFEDCEEETQDKWLDGLLRSEAINLAKGLARTLNEIGDQFYIYK